MMPQVRTYRARRVPAADFSSAQSLLAKAARDSEEIIAQAQARAEEITSAASDEKSRLEQSIAELYEQENRIAEEARLRAAEGENIVHLLAEAAEIRDEFETLTPWLRELVDTCVKRIVGELDDDERTTRLLAVGIAEMRTAHQLVLRVCSDDYARVSGLRQRFPETFSAVGTILPDPDVPADTLFLEGAAGFVELGFEGTRQALIDHLEAALEERDAEPC